MNSYLTWLNISSLFPQADLHPSWEQVYQGCAVLQSINQFLGAGTPGVGSSTINQFLGAGIPGVCSSTINQSINSSEQIYQGNDCSSTINQSIPGIEQVYQGCALLQSINSWEQEYQGCTVLQSINSWEQEYQGCAVLQSVHKINHQSISLIINVYQLI